MAFEHILQDQTFEYGHSFYTPPNDNGLKAMSLLKEFAGGVPKCDLFYMKRHQILTA